MELIQTLEVNIIFIIDLKEFQTTQAIYYLG